MSNSKNSNADVKMTQPKLENRLEQHYVGIRTLATLQEMGSGLIPRLHGEVMDWLQTQGVAPGAPFVRFYVINMESTLDIEMGWPVDHALEGNGRVTAGVLPAGRYATLIYTGVHNGITGNKALIEWAQENGLTWDRWDVENGDAFRARLETYLTDPDDEPDLEKWEIEVAIKLADKH